MFPNLFLKTFWQMDLRPQIFVAMSFSEVYKQRYSEVIEPAIRAIRVNGVPLQPYRVDLSKSGDSILTDIMDGIAHCQLFLADVSVIGHDSRTGQTYRNGNVMYEVGLAVACRQATEILLVRDDQDKFLFDVSTIPHIHLDFADPATARTELQETMIGRLRERQLIADARLRKSVASLTSEELKVIELFGDNAPPAAWGFRDDGSINFLARVAIPRLFDKQLVKLVGTWTGGGAACQWTQLGFATVQIVKNHLPTFRAEEDQGRPGPQDDAQQTSGDKASSQ